MFRSWRSWKQPPPAKRARVQKGPQGTHGAGELARPNRVKPVVSEPSGSHRLHPLTDRAQNPMGACRVKQTDEVPGGVSRQEGAKPWRRKGCRLGKPAVDVLQTATSRQARASQKGLPVLMAPKGQKPHERCCPGNGQRAEVAVRGVARCCKPWTRERRSGLGPNRGAHVRLALKRRKACERMILL